MYYYTTILGLASRLSTTAPAQWRFSYDFVEVRTHGSTLSISIWSLHNFLLFWNRVNKWTKWQIKDLNLKSQIVIRDLNHEDGECIFVRSSSFCRTWGGLLCTKIVLNIRNNLCTRHVLPRFTLGIFMYWTCNSMINLSSYIGLVDSKIRTSDKGLPLSL